MKLPENMSKIVCKNYKGQKDDEGHFEHGVRSGYGVWHETIRFIREYEPWEWAQMGDYDSAGRLIRPNINIYVLRKSSTLYGPW